VGTEITEKFWSNHLKLLDQDVEEITAFIPSGLEAKQIWIRRWDCVFGRR
jgi:hypothetical protein